MQVCMINESNITLNDIDDGVEEDSNFDILLTAVNATGRSQAPIISNRTEEAGMLCNFQNKINDGCKIYW